MDWTPGTLGPWLRQLRTRAGFSLDALGERVGRTRQQLISYEKGQRDPGATTLLKILAELGATIEAPVPAPQISSVTGELERLEQTIQDMRDAIAVSGAGIGATASAVELVRRLRLGEKVPAAQVERAAEALDEAVREYQALAADLREAAAAARTGS